VRKIVDMEDLKRVAKETRCECFILLNGGLRSSKSVIWEPRYGRFWISNEIDGSTQWLTVKQMAPAAKLTNIGEAIEKGAFYLDE
jgi:hypothetical protein